MKDLIVLVADKNMEFTLRGILERIPNVENIESLNFDIYSHPGHDPVIYNDSHDLLRGLTNSYRYCIAILDHEGSGQENRDNAEVESDIENNLSVNGWNERCCAVAISPELENWIWVNSTHLHEAVSWQQQTDIYQWLVDKGFNNENSNKPEKPKEAFEAVLELSNTPRSSAIYYEITNRASYRNCTDPAFNKFIETIRKWFG